MATQIIRQQETRAITAVPRINRERVGEFFSAVGSALRLPIGAPYETYAVGKSAGSISPTEKAVIDAYGWGMRLR